MISATEYTKEIKIQLFRFAIAISLITAGHWYVVFKLELEDIMTTTLPKNPLAIVKPS